MTSPNFSIARQEQLVIEIIRESTNLLEHACKGKEEREIATKAFREALDTLIDTNFEGSEDL